MVYEAEKLVRENREKIPVVDLNALEQASTGARSLLDSPEATLPDLERHQQELQAALQKVGQTLYKQAGEQPGASGDSPPSDPETGEDGDVVDAEFSEEK